MPINRLAIDGVAHWELDHDLPVLWPWLFDPAAITESRRLHATVHEAAGRFTDRRLRVSKLGETIAFIHAFADLTPDRFPRAMDARPDTVVMLDLGPLEAQRPYDHASKSSQWMAFERACEQNDKYAALSAWEEASMSPLRLHGSVQRDALGLAARAEAFGLPRTGSGRAQALVWLLFGKPITRPAKALNHQWVEQIALWKAVGFVPRKPWWSRLLGR